MKTSDRLPVLNPLVTEYERLAEDSRAFIEALGGAAHGERVYVIGNGPSLRELPPVLVQREVVVACNLGALWCGSHPRLMVQLATDSAALLMTETALGGRRRVEWMSEQSGHIMASTERVTREWLDACKAHGVHVMPAPFCATGIRTRTPHSRWWSFASGPIYAGWTVAVTAIDLAVFMGAREIVLLGVDMDYTRGAHFFEGSSGVTRKWSFERHSRPVFLQLAADLERMGVSLLRGTDTGALTFIPCIA